MSAALVVTGLVTVCCGDHHPAEGEASVCLCCPECVTNAVMGRLPQAARREVARLRRDEFAAYRMWFYRALRSAWATLVHDAVEERVRSLATASRHAVALPVPPARPVLPELDAACPWPQMQGRLS